ncbi:hypothetical protein J6590_005659, partial [Homalodisca vitripennis]
MLRNWDARVKRWARSTAVDDCWSGSKLIANETAGTMGVYSTNNNMAEGGGNAYCQTRDGCTAA